MSTQPSEIAEMLWDKRLRGIKLLRNAGFAYLDVLAVGPISFDPPKVFAFVATRRQQMRAVYLRGIADVLESRWKSSKDLLGHVRSQINRAALRLYKQWREECRKYWASPEGKAESRRQMQAFLDATAPIVKNYIDRSAETYRRFAQPKTIRYAHSTGSKYF